MKIDKHKFDRQCLAIERWRVNKGRGMWIHPTGMGKTFTAITLIDKFNAPPETYIICPRIGVYDEWHNEFKNVAGEVPSNVNIWMIDRLEKHIEAHGKLETDLMIFDELHMFLTDRRASFIDGRNCTARFALGLTATWNVKAAKCQYINEYLPVVDEIPEDEAIEEGWITNYIEFNIGIDLDEATKQDYDAYTGVISKELPKFNKNLNTAIRCLSGGRDANGRWVKGIHFATGVARANGYDRENGDAQINAVWNPGKVMHYAKQLMTAIGNRTELLYNYRPKIDLALLVIEKFPEDKIICFSESTAYADLLQLEINTLFKDTNKSDLFDNSLPEIATIYHTNLQTIKLPSPKTGKMIKFGKKKLKERAIERFRSGASRIMVTASALDMGFNVKDVTIALVSSGTSNPFQHKQRGGRVKRLFDAYVEDRPVLIINFYVRDTQEEKWLRNRQRGNSNRVYWIDSVDDISHSPISTFNFL